MDVKWSGSNSRLSSSVIGKKGQSICEEEAWLSWSREMDMEHLKELEYEPNQ